MPEMTLSLHDDNDLISIIIVHKDRPEHLIICLQSILICSENNNYEIIVVDNGSGEESQEVLNEIEKKVKLIRNGKNLYFGPAATIGVQAADPTSKYFVWLHCDIIIQNASWLDILLNVVHNQSAGLVGCELSEYFLEGTKVTSVMDHLFMMTRECWDRCGPFPPELPQLHTNFIMTMKCAKYGYKPQIVTNSLCFHWKATVLSINEFEKLKESGQAATRRLMQELMEKK